MKTFDIIADLRIIIKSCLAHKISPCYCGIKPHIERETTEYTRVTQYRFGCDCGETGEQADTIPEAAENWNKVISEEIAIQYCSNCCMKFKLPFTMQPISGDTVVAGYCRLCGVAGPIISTLPRKYFKDRGIVISTLKQLSDGITAHQVDKV
ncbi:MAG: hypothetical protein ABSH16_00120 [Sedimentisphaerales bacterium]